MLPLSDIKRDMMNTSDTRQYFDATSQAVFLFNEKRRLFVSFDSKETAKRKAKFAMLNNLAGLSAWKLSGDLPGNESLWQSVTETLGPIPTPTTLNTTTNQTDLYAFRPRYLLPSDPPLFTPPPTPDTATALISMITGIFMLKRWKPSMFVNNSTSLT